MEEYYASEADAREARPRRQTRPPQHLHDYEVSYGNHRPHLSPYHSVVEHNSPERQEEQYSHQERAAKMDSFTSLRLTPPTYQAQWDAVPQWDNPSHHHGPEMQLAHSRQRGKGGGQHNEEIREATPHWEHWKKSADHQAELDMIRYENNKLHSTRLAITGQMAELERVKYEMMKLMDKASSLHPHSDATGNHYTPAKSTRQPPAQTTWFDSTLPPSIPPSVSEEGSNESEEEYNEEEYSKWPEPPPWPTEVRPKQQEGEQVVELLNRMMGELKVIRDQAIPVVAKPSQTQAVNAPGHTWQHPRGLNHQYGGYSQPLQQVSEAPPQHYSGTAGQRFIPARPDPPVAAFGPPDTARQRTVEYQVPRPIHASFASRPEPQPQWCIGPAYNTPQTYRGPRPTIPNFSSRDPSEFARLKIALENLLPPDGNERFKYQILADHLKLEEACLVADSFLNSTTPYSDTMAALTEKFGQPHHVALKKIASVMDSPDVRRGDTAGFEKFALKIQSLVGMLRTLGQEGDIELRCGSHVARLLSKLPRR
ncbi:hypothetical protein DPEC_G00261600 [Dallia pectoralis]|uniref:Uncharacterized protein n=1 Tax=Dallia pectoralis TaxID=75939 RepID=A0ACC2FRN4_DALPE|nr:hypothetical protein DPEC_G00261600 [Dallia pectoralis]